MKLMITYEDYLIWKKSRFSTYVLKHMLESYYNVPLEEVEDIDHGYGRTIEIYFKEKELYDL